MPAQSRLVKRKNKKPANKKKKSRKYVIASLVAILALPIIYFFLPKTWNGSDRLSLAVNGKDDIKVVVFDPSTSTITTINIPPSTQVNAARDLGSWQLSSIWELGRNEGRLGLLAQSITKTFKIPVEYWSDASRSDTNLTLKDRISLAYFEFRVNASNKREVDLVETGSLEKAQIKGVGEGYVLTRPLPPSIIGLFNLADENTEDWMAHVIDASGPTYEISELTKIIDNTGVKVISITNDDVSELGCEVSGNNQKAVDYFKKLFSCTLSRDLKTGSFGVVLKIGTSFVL